jgi:hypothetical protein
MKKASALVNEKDEPIPPTNQVSAPPDHYLIRSERAKRKAAERKMQRLREQALKVNEGTAKARAAIAETESAKSHAQVALVVQKLKEFEERYSREKEKSVKL